MMWRPQIAAVTAILTITLLATTVWYAYSSGRQSGMSLIQSRWDAEVAQMAQAQAEEIMKARQREKALEALIARQREEHRREANRIAARYRSDIERLRDRPEARADFGGVPGAADSGAGCTGAGLARPDGEFLVRYAASAARLQSALNACVTAYDEVRRQVNRD